MGKTKHTKYKVGIAHGRINIIYASNLTFLTFPSQLDIYIYL